MDIQVVTRNFGILRGLNNNGLWHTSESISSR